MKRVLKGLKTMANKIGAGTWVAIVSLIFGVSTTIAGIGWWCINSRIDNTELKISEKITAETAAIKEQAGLARRDANNNNDMLKKIEASGTKLSQDNSKHVAVIESQFQTMQRDIDGLKDGQKQLIQEQKQMRTEQSATRNDITKIITILEEERRAARMRDRNTTPPQ
jgi:hypothetical protein